MNKIEINLLEMKRTVKYKKLKGSETKLWTKEKYSRYINEEINRRKTSTNRRFGKKEEL